ncbi:hypothetical protein D3C72_2206910 [compost metagenome]
MIEHFGIFAKTDNYIKWKRRNVLFERNLKSFKAHAYTNGWGVFLRTFLKVLFSIFEFGQGLYNEIIKYLSLFCGDHLPASAFK